MRRRQRRKKCDGGMHAMHSPIQANIQRQNTIVALMFVRMWDKTKTKLLKQNRVQ